MQQSAGQKKRELDALHRAAVGNPVHVTVPSGGSGVNLAKEWHAHNSGQQRP